MMHYFTAQDIVILDTAVAEKEAAAIQAKIQAAKEEEEAKKNASVRVFWAFGVKTFRKFSP